MICFPPVPASLLLILALAASLLAQQPPAAPAEDVPTIKVDVDLVNILCSVRDKRGGLQANLEKDDFTVYEDGKTQEIRLFSRETDLPLTIGLLVDVSGSQANLIEVEREAAHQFFSQVLGKKDMAFLISFGPDVELMQDFTNSTRLLQDALNDLRIRSGVGGLGPGPVPTMNKSKGTVLFDAVYLAAYDKLRQEVGRKALILITDGVDVGSHYKIQHAIEQAQKSDAIVYSIYYVDRGAYSGFGFGGASDSDLKKISNETGGRVFHVDRKNSLPEIFKEIQQELRSQYAIAYSPTNGAKDGSFREVEIKTKDKNYKVQARKGYYAPTK